MIVFWVLGFCVTPKASWMDQVPSRAAFSSFVKVWPHVPLDKDNWLGNGFVLPFFTSPPLFRNSWIKASSVVGFGTCFIVAPFTSFAWSQVWCGGSNVGWAAQSGAARPICYMFGK